jgi:hypothetical protein
VVDGQSDRIIEYGGVKAVEAGQPFSTTPRRVFDVALPAALVANLSCASAPTINDFAVSQISGTIYAQTNCDNSAATTWYTLTYPASTQEAAPAPGSSPVPPVPGTFSVTTAAGEFPGGIQLAEPQNTVFLAYLSQPFTSNIIGVPIGTFSNPTTNIGSVCLQELGQSASCGDGITTTSYSGYGGFGVDQNGFLYLPTFYNTDASGNAAVPPGSVSQQASNEPAVLIYPAGTVNSAPSPFSALAGFTDELGEASGAPLTIAIEGSTLYVLPNPGEIYPPPPGNTVSQVFAGLSGCPPMGPNFTSAVPDIPTSLCQNGNTTAYIAAFPNATQALTSSAAAGTDVIAPPAVMLGGDVLGGFGGAAIGTRCLAVRDGFAYVLNASPPSGSSFPEIDVYNLNGLAGYSTDIGPLTRLIITDPTISPIAIAIGPTGTGVGGQALLRHPARVHHDVRAWLRTLQERRRAHHHLAPRF